MFATSKLSSSRKWRLLAEKTANLPAVTFHKKSKIKRGRFRLSAPVLAAGKGWVLAVLAMLGPSGPARGCARLRSRRQKAPPLPSAVRRGGVEVSGRRVSRHNDAPRALPRRRRTKGGSGGGVLTPLSSCPGPGSGEW